MTTEISKYVSAEGKDDLAVSLQMARLQLDSDWNTQSELWLRRHQRQTEDTIGSGSPNEGFRITDLPLLDLLDDRAPWSAAPDPAAGAPAAEWWVDYAEFRTGRGSLAAHHATELVRACAPAVNLTGIRLVRFGVLGTFAPAQVRFFIEHGGVRHGFVTTEVPGGVGGRGEWRLFEAVPPGGLPAGALPGVEAYGFDLLDPPTVHHFDFLAADLPIRTPVMPVRDARDFVPVPNAPTDNPSTALDLEHRRDASPVLRVSGAETLRYAFPGSTDLSHLRELVTLVRREGGGALGWQLRAIEATGPANEVLLAITSSENLADGWELRRYALPQAGLDWTRVGQLRLSGLDPAATYHVAPAFGLMALQPNLVITGGDGTVEGAGRFYAGGLAASRPTAETYFSQRDLPDPDPAALAPAAEAEFRVDLAYLDVWERTVTYIEDPEIREVALEGLDTCTRTRLVSQVRVLKGTPAATQAGAKAPFAALAALAPTGGGRLTTKDSAPGVPDPCGDPCEPEVEGDFAGEENQLYRLEVHRAGAIGPAANPGTALLKWSAENAAVASAVREPLAAGALAAVVELPDLFRPGNLIEIADDYDDLISGPHLSRTATRGELRRVTTVNRQARSVSWEQGTGADPFNAPLARAYGLPRHPRGRRWDGLVPATPGDIHLADGVTIELTGSDLIPGDYWAFTTRVPGRTVERLVEAPPRGTAHRYYPLATLSRKTAAGQSFLQVDDLRARVPPLTGLDAADIGFDPGECLQVSPAWADTRNVQQALDALCRLTADEDLRLHNQMLHGHGVVCGLKMICHPSREQLTLEPGYALECDGTAIRVRRPMAFPVLERATAAGLLAGAPLAGKALVRIRPGVNQEAALSVEPFQPQAFWDEVLEGTLLKDFYDHCIKTLFDFVKQQFFPLPDNTVPVTPNHARAQTLLNLIYQLINPASGRYVWLSFKEHQILAKFYDDLRALVASETYCGMFDGDTPFPAYRFGKTPGIDTVFGLWRFHRRLRPHPGGRYAYSCLGDATIQVFDLETRSLVAHVTFPGGSGTQVQDVAFNQAGTEMYVAANMGPDAALATVTIGANQSHTWGPVAVVCDRQLLRLATHPKNPASLYATGRGATAADCGLYIFTPTAWPVGTAAPAVTGDVSGLLTVSDDGQLVYIAERVLGPTPAGSFDRIRAIAAGTHATIWILDGFTGRDVDNDVVPDGAGHLLLTTNPLGPQAKSLHRIVQNTGKIVWTTDILFHTRSAVAPLPTVDAVLVALADECKLIQVGLTTGRVRPNYRVPAQIWPVAVATRPGGAEVCVLNFPNTIGVVEVPTVVTAGVQPAFTFEPPALLSADRQQMLDAFGDLLGHLGQHLKDCFFDQFLIDCPDCHIRPEVYLGMVEFENGKVKHICNFTRRHYVKSFRTYGYWLSTVPILPLFKKVWKELGCLLI